MEPWSTFKQKLEPMMFVSPQETVIADSMKTFSPPTHARLVNHLVQPVQEQEQPLVLLASLEKNWRFQHAWIPALLMVFIPAGITA
jgi:hypothetical protein